MYLYLMYCNGYIKIGISKTPHKRRNSINYATPFKVSLIDTIELDSINSAEELESFLHDQLNKWNISSEWFKGNNKSINKLNQSLEKCNIDIQYKLVRESEINNNGISDLPIIKSKFKTENQELKRQVKELKNQVSNLKTKIKYYKNQ